MKTFRVLPVLFTVLLLGLCRPVQAQVMKTNDFALPFSLITAGANSNVVGFANSGPYAAAAALKINAPALGVTFTYSFQCATVTLANAAIVLQGSTDNATWPNLPGGAGTWTLNTGASASTANNTNVVYSTNISQAALGNYLYFRVAGGTNANSANLTSPRLTAAWY